MKTTINQPKQLITKEFAKQLNQEYNAERANLKARITHEEDANAVWYSLEELENYINYIKEEGESQGIEVTGIRFYLGVYPKNTEAKEKIGKTTIFLTPTKKNDVDGVMRFAVMEENVDATEIEPMNYGTMGNPPKLEYGG